MACSYVASQSAWASVHGRRPTRSSHVIVVVSRLLYVSVAGGDLAPADQLQLEQGWAC